MGNPNGVVHTTVDISSFFKVLDGIEVPNLSLCSFKTSGSRSPGIDFEMRAAQMLNHV